MDSLETQALADAFVEKLQELGIRIFPETAKAVAEEVASEHNKDNDVPVAIIVSRKFNELVGLGQEKTASVDSLSSKISAMESELVALAARGPITPEEIKQWQKRIYDEVYVPFHHVGEEISESVAEYMKKLEDASTQKHEAEEEFEVLVKKANEAFKKLVESGSPKVGPWRRRYANAKGELIRKADEITSKTTEMNFSRAMMIYLTGASDYLQKTVRAPENFGTQIDGASAYLKQARISLGDISEIINSLKDRKNPNRLQLKEMVKEGPERHKLPLWMSRSLSNNPTLTAQTASIGPAVSSIDMNEFENSSVFYEAGRRLWEKINQEMPESSQEEKLAAYNTRLEHYKNDVANKFQNLNKLPDTWKKFREMYELLDPESPEQVAALHSSKEELPSSYNKWETPTKIQGMTPDPDDDQAMRTAKNYMNNKNTRAWTELRKMAEAQNENAHWSMLYALSNLQSLKYDTKTGKTYGEEFLNELPADKRNDPAMVNVAQKIDGLLSDKRKQLALQVALNKNVPDWILMKLSSIGYRSVVGDKKVQKEQDESYDFIRKVAYETLLNRGWKLKRSPEGKPVGHKLGPGEFGFEFEKNPDKLKTAATKIAQTVQSPTQNNTQTNPQLQSIDTQIQSENDQVRGLQRQIEQHQQRIKTLNDSKKPLQEEQARVQQTSTKMMSDYQQGNPVQPTTPLAP